MKILAILAIIACFALASELEYQDIHTACIDAGVPYVITDTEVYDLEVSCGGTP